MKTFNLRFYLRRGKNKKINSEQKIYARITVDGKRADFTINRAIHPSRWDRNTMSPKGKSESDIELRKYLKTVEDRLYQIERELIENRVKVTAGLLKDRFQGIEPKHKTLMDAFKVHHDRFEKLVSVGDKSPATLQRYVTSMEHVEQFMMFKYYVEDMDLRDLDMTFIDEYELFLRIERSCSNNTAVKYVQNLRKVVRFAIKHGWIKNDPFMLYEGKVKPVQRDFLSEEELDRIIGLNIKNERLDIVRDVFLFSCFTGYSYSDVKELSKKHLHTDNDGNKWLLKSRKKTAVKSDVILLPPAIRIIEKYAFHPKCLDKDVLLPVLSNQKLNAYLKEIIDLAQIEKRVTFHTARHTFATTITLANGIPLETVSAQLGHTNLRQTQHYAKMVNQRVASDMTKLNLKYK